MKYQMGSVGDVDKLHAEANQAASESISAVRVVQVGGEERHAFSLQAEIMKGRPLLLTQLTN